MLDKSGWPTWFLNVTDKASKKLLKNADYVPDIESGLKNVTKAFFWPYAYLGSREELSYIVKSNFSIGNKKSLLHISQQCFVPYKVGILLPKQSVYSDVFSYGIQQILQSGLILKMKGDVEWNMLRSATGKLLAANSKTGSLKLLTYEDRALTLDDTQGMFLLLGAGFLVGGGIFLSEVFGGCLNICRTNKSSISSSSSLGSNSDSHYSLTKDFKQHSSRRDSLTLNLKKFKKVSSVDSTFGDVVEYEPNVNILVDRKFKSAEDYNRSCCEEVTIKKRSRSCDNPL